MVKVRARIHLNLKVALAVAAVLVAGMATLLVDESILDKPPWEEPAQTLTPADPWTDSTRPADGQATTGKNSGADRIRSNSGAVVPVPLPVPVARDGFGSYSSPQPLTVPSFFPPTATMVPVPRTVPVVDPAPVSPGPPVTIGATTAAPTFVPAVTPAINPVGTPSAPAKPTLVFTPTITPVFTPTIPPTPTVAFTPTPHPTPVPTATVPPPPPTVDMNLSASANTVQVGSSLVVEVWVEPRHNSRVDAAQVFLAFDPSILRVVTISRGNRLEEQLHLKTDNVGGRAGFAAGTLGPAGSSRFKLASVEFQVVGVTGPRGSPVRFGPSKAELVTRSVYQGTDNTGVLGPPVVVVVREGE